MERFLPEKRAPSAEKFKSKLWRPLAVMALTLSSQAVSEAQFTPQYRTLSIYNPSILKYMPQIPEPSFPDLPHQKEEIKDRTNCGEIYGTDYQSEAEREYYLKVCNTPETVKAHIAQWLREAEWPEELIDEAVNVSHGCESGGNPKAVSKNGLNFGLFQLDLMWFHYAGEDPNKWDDPIVNARVALRTYYYDIDRGQLPWAQWACKPRALTAR